MAFVKLKATTFLVGEESLNSHAFAIKPTGLFHKWQIGHQIDGFFAFPIPPENDHHRTVSSPGEQEIMQCAATIGPRLTITQTHPSAFVTDLGILGGSTDAFPARTVIQCRYFVFANRALIVDLGGLPTQVNDCLR